MLYYPIVDQT